MEGCGDGVCSLEEDAAGCPEDCTCGDGQCASNESASACASDCAGADLIAQCEDRCAAEEYSGCFIRLGNELYSGMYRSCMRQCRQAPRPAVDAYLACTAGPDEPCSSCLYDALSTCGDGYCELQEDDISLGVEGGWCPEDCGTLDNTDGAWLNACGGYNANQCWMFDDDNDECHAHCWGARPADRLAFAQCADPEDGSECLHQDCTAYLGMKCGDLMCDQGEDATNCPLDCGDVCGDAWCSSSETADSCPQDCSTTCGDGWCAIESCSSCPEDCGTCAGFCGDGTCAAGETCSGCSVDCGACGATCGDGTCNNDESCASCQSDCGACPTPAGACYDEFRIITTPFWNSNGQIGGDCGPQGYQACTDGTVLMRDDVDPAQCICTPLCANLATNAGDFEPCLQSDPNFICVPALGYQGDWARICVHVDSNLCYEQR